MNLQLFSQSVVIENEELWKRLEDYTFDDETSDLPFSQRLATDNDWSLDYAHRVLEEYKRFLYLGLVAGHKVTPSDEVDQAWHLHMIYTEEYWDHFCPHVLGVPFHHGPTKGGKKEHDKHTDWYLKTKETYVRTFGERPPEDIWPPNAIRFGRRHMRISTDEYVIVKKSDFPVVSRLIIKILDTTLNLGKLKLKGKRK
jgi:hypothetical protein